MNGEGYAVNALNIIYFYIYLSFFNVHWMNVSLQNNWHGSIIYDERSAFGFCDGSQITFCLLINHSQSEFL